MTVQKNKKEKTKTLEIRNDYQTIAQLSKQEVTNFQQSRQKENQRLNIKANKIRNQFNEKRNALIF